MLLLLFLLFGYFCSKTKKHEISTDEIRVQHGATIQSLTTLSRTTGLIVKIRNKTIPEDKAVSSNQMHFTLYHATDDESETNFLDLLGVLGRKKEYMKFMAKLYGQSFIKTLTALREAENRVLSALPSSSSSSSSASTVDGSEKTVTDCEVALKKAVRER